MDVPIVYTPAEEIANPMECVNERLWAVEDRDVKRVVDEVFSHVSGGSGGWPRRRNGGGGGVVACGIRSFLRSVGVRWH